MKKVSSLLIFILLSINTFAVTTIPKLDMTIGNTETPDDLVTSLHIKLTTRNVTTGNNRKLMRRNRLITMHNETYMKRKIKNTV